MPSKCDDEMQISTKIPFSSWLALKTAAAASGMAQKDYLAKYLGEAKPYPRESKEEHSR